MNMPKAKFFLPLTSLLAGVCLAPMASAQVNNGIGAVKQIYQENCAACHGENLKGAIGPSLLDEVWIHGNSNKQITHSIAQGYPEKEMPGFAEILSDDEIRSLVIYMAEEKSLAEKSSETKTQVSPDHVYSSQYANFKLEPVIKTKGEIWSMEFLPDGSFFATELKGKLLQISKDGKAKSVKKIPKVWAKGQGGLLDVKLHPNYAENGWVYLSMAVKAGKNSAGSDIGMTQIVRGRVIDGCWEDQEILFQFKPEHATAPNHHFGSRIEFFDGYLYFSVGERGDQDKAQLLDWPHGKIHRLHDDGRVPEDNPFVDVEGAYPSIWSYGHRNPQGMTVGGPDGALYTTEHGPRGGDELNRPERGKNYGWPVITYGMNYDGTAVTALTAKDGMEQPLHYWVPSIATAGLTSVESEDFADWNGDLLAAGLQSEELHRLRVDGSRVVEDEILFKGLGRIRDVIQGADGHIYAVVNEERRGPSVVYRLLPVD
ncbi:PQQ-dependent sugar dehydrogenase [Hirschia litorea]|uniref:PQQ-dependent sugar dehydrogenase n=1 Tax=Hirschia litorea TaxID=1199156 RepID=A0ABW2IPC7_9PROT